MIQRTPGMAFSEALFSYLWVRFCFNPRTRFQLLFRHINIYLRLQVRLKRNPKQRGPAMHVFTGWRTSRLPPLPILPLRQVFHYGSNVYRVWSYLWHGHWQVRFALSSSPVFSRTDTVTDSEKFYNTVLDLLEDIDESVEVNHLLIWWNPWQPLTIMLSFRLTFL